MRRKSWANTKPTAVEKDMSFYVLSKQFLPLYTRPKAPSPILSNSEKVTLSREISILDMSLFMLSLSRHGWESKYVWKSRKVEEEGEEEKKIQVPMVKANYTWEWREDLGLKRLTNELVLSHFPFESSKGVTGQS